MRLLKSRYGERILFADETQPTEAQNKDAEKPADKKEDKPVDDASGLGITKDQRELLMNASLEQVKQNTKILAKLDQLVTEDFSNPEPLKAKALDLAAEFVRNCMGEKLGEGMVLERVVAVQEECETDALNLVSKWIADAAQSIGLTTPAQPQTTGQPTDQSAGVTSSPLLGGLPSLGGGITPAAPAAPAAGGTLGLTGLDRDITSEEGYDLIQFLDIPKPEEPEWAKTYRQKPINQKSKQVTTRKPNREAQEMIDLLIRK